MSHMDAVDPNHAMQLHASHSTPSLETVAVSESSSSDVAGSSRHITTPSGSSQQRKNGAKASGAKEVKTLAPVIDICANTAEIGFPPVVTSPESDQSRSSQHHVTSPSFPIIVTETPNTPSLVPTDPLPNQGSHTLFSPHQLSHRPELHSHNTEVAQKSNSGLTRASLSAPQDNLETAENQPQADLAGRGLSLSDQISHGSISLGTSLNCISTALVFFCLECVLCLLCHTQVCGLKAKWEALKWRSRSLASSLFSCTDNKPRFAVPMTSTSMSPHPTWSIQWHLHKMLTYPCMQQLPYWSTMQYSMVMAMATQMLTVTTSVTAQVMSTGLPMS